MMHKILKPLHWVASARGDLKGLPDDVQDSFGYALHRAQEGARHSHAKPLRGFSGASVLEVVENYDGDTYRAVYTIRFALAVYVLHVFQKKSRKGMTTPQADINLIKSRLKLAADAYARDYERKKP